MLRTSEILFKAKYFIAVLKNLKNFISIAVDSLLLPTYVKDHVEEEELELSAKVTNPILVKPLKNSNESFCVLKRCPWNKNKSCTFSPSRRIEGDVEQEKD